MRREPNRQKVNTTQISESTLVESEAEFDAGEIYFGDDFPGCYSVDDDEYFDLEEICWLSSDEFEPAHVS